MINAIACFSTVIVAGCVFGWLISFPLTVLLSRSLSRNECLFNRAAIAREDIEDRALAAGFTSVSSLVKDGDGIWRGTAMRDGKVVKLAVDYKGNVVSN